MDLQITIVMLERKEMQCCVHAREGKADYDGGGDHWEDITEQVSVHPGLELCKLLMEERCFRQREWQ